MYEFDNSYFNSIIEKLCTLQVIIEIDKYIKAKTKGVLSVCFPTHESKQNTIYFIIHGDENISLEGLAIILHKIKHNINYDETHDHPYVMVAMKEMLRKDAYLNYYEDYTEYAPANLVKIKEFFTKHFSANSSPIKNEDKAVGSKRKLSTHSLWEHDKPTPEEKNEKKVESNDISIQERAVIEDILKRVECLSPAARELFIERLEKRRKHQLIAPAPNNTLAKTT